MEITKALYLSDNEHRMLDMHAMLNILNVIIGELTLVQVDLPENGAIKKAINEARSIKKILNDQDREQFTAKAIAAFRTVITEMLRDIRQAYIKAKSPEEYEQFEQNMQNILSIMDVRVDELLARWKFPDQWLTFTKDQLRRELTEFLEAMALNARKRYGFVYDPEEHTADNYLVKFDLIGENGAFTIPFALKDVLRDLVANARKYTQPGGILKVTVFEVDHKLNLAVEDNGRGIPQEQIEEVFDYGKRASNVQDKRTMGGSFGLTKALEVTRHFHGRMWVDSKTGQGTRITIEVPVYQ